MPYSVPAGYFEELNKREVVPVNQPAAKVISITRQPWFRYAAAAIVTGVVVLAGFLIFSRSNSVDPAKESSKWVEVNLKKVNTDDIDKFVQLADEGAPVIAMTDVRDAIQEINEIKELMKDVPEKDLQNFLDETETLADEPAGDEDVLMN